MTTTDDTAELAQLVQMAYNTSREVVAEAERQFTANPDDTNRVFRIADFLVYMHAKAFVGYYNSVNGEVRRDVVSSFSASAAALAYTNRPDDGTEDLLAELERSLREDS